MESPKVILNCKQGYFSIARHFGGAKIQGKEYKYIPEEDALIRKDLIKKFNSLKKSGNKFEDIIKSL